MADKGKGKKRSKAFYVRGSNKKMRRDKFLDVGMRGFLLTCNRVEQLCVRDAHSLLGEYADKLYGPEKVGGNDNASSENDSESEPDDIEASLQKEVAQMKQKQAQKTTRFEAINSGAKNVVFIRTKLPDPTELVHYLLTDIATTQTSKSCHIMRMLPVNVTCRATTEDITKHAPEFLRPYFHADGVSPTTFAVRIKIRNNAAVKRDDVIKLVAGIVMAQGKEHKVDLDSPDLSVVVEIVKNVCCLSVVRDFNKLKRYNVQEIVGGGALAAKAIPGRSAKKGTQEVEAIDTSETGLHQQQSADAIADDTENQHVLGDSDLDENVSSDREKQTLEGHKNSDHEGGTPVSDGKEQHLTR